ncbi:transmembrane protein 176B-like [Pleurodeles waltl]|uniref:transmembrane protein 176B-like n=1 Tax=Pleurodeles waltl TaxID=8319 RepID=UPI003709A361
MSSCVVETSDIETLSNASEPEAINFNINEPSGMASLLNSTKAAWKGQPAAKADTMSSSVMKTNDIEVSSDASKPTVINVNINQPSGLASLLESVKVAMRRQPDAKDGDKVSSSIFRGEQKVLGALQIIIGLVCLSFGVIAGFYEEGFMLRTGSGFWTGILFILSGCASIIGEKRASKPWIYIATLMNLLSLCAAIAGFGVSFFDLMWNPGWLTGFEYFCDPKVFYRYGYDRITDSLGSDWRVTMCNDALSKLMGLFNGMRIINLVAIVLALCITLYSVGYGIRTLFCAPTSQQDKEVMAEKEKDHGLPPKQSQELQHL